MFNSIRRHLGFINVRQTADEIIVRGIPADVMARDISRIWGTSKINTYMFLKIDKNSFTILNFFAPDVVYAIETILKDKTRKSSVRFLSTLLDKLYTDTWLSSIKNRTHKSRLNFEKLKEMVYEPLPFQKEFMEFYNTKLDEYKLKGYLLAGTAGSGKTFCSLAISNCLEADLVIVICLKNAIERVWEHSVKTLFTKQQSYWMAHAGKPLKGDERFLMGHYEALDLVTDAVKIRMSKLGPNSKIVIILDESHFFNEITSLRTEKFISLCSFTESQNIIWLSGTAIKALGSESIPLLKTIDPYFTNDVQDRFKKIYGKDAKKGLDILRNRIGLVSFKVEKSELNLLDPIMVPVKIKMPTGMNYTLAAISIDMKNYVIERKKFYALTEKHDTQTFYKMLDIYETTLISKEEKEQYAKYRKYLEFVIASYLKNDLKSAKEESIFCNRYEKIISLEFKEKEKELFKHVKTIAKYVLLKIQGECLGRVLSRKRIECHVDMVSHIDFVGICESTVKKTIVFTSFVEALKETNKVCDNLGLMPKVVYGDTNNDLVSILKQFESDSDTNPLIATYNSLGTSLPLIMADTMIIINFPFRDYIFQQAISRIHRLGADTQTYIYTVTLDTGYEPNISTRSADILSWSQKQVTAILGIESPFEIIDGQTPGLEKLEEDVFLKLVSDDYDVEEIITFESFRDIMKPYEIEHRELIKERMDKAIIKPAKESLVDKSGFTRW